MSARPLTNKHPVFIYRNGLFEIHARLYILWLDDYRHVRLFPGQATNFASIPWFGRWMISPIDERVVRASMAHDYLVGEFNAVGSSSKAKPHIIYADGNGRLKIDYDVDWDKAAAIFKKLLKEDGLDPVRRSVMYWAVRSWQPWMKLKRWVKKISQ